MLAPSPLAPSTPVSSTLAAAIIVGSTRPERRASAVTQRVHGIAGFDAFVFVTPEYNHSLPAALRNAIDFIFAAWNNKAAAIVSYGSGARAAEHLRSVLGEVKAADVRAHVMLSLCTDFENMTTFTPAALHEKEVMTMLDDLLAWAGALKALRS